MAKKLSKFKIFWLVLWLPFVLYARQIETFYGPIEVQESVLLELIDHPLFQRLKNIHQYGVAYYTTHKEEYSRYDHSIGVFAILRENGAPLKEQIAGLLHDVSHTAFSHVGDWIFGKENQNKGYQDGIHAWFLEKSGFIDILKKYNFTINQILPKEELFPALENTLPNLCADRIDYNIQGAYYRNYITYEEAKTLFKDLKFINGKWISSRPDLMNKLAYFSLFMTQHCWGSPTNYVTSRWLADAILRGIDLGTISYDEIHFGTDQEIWDKLIFEKDSVIQKKMDMILNSQLYFTIVDSIEDADFFINSKFRGIDPFISKDFDTVRLTEIDKSFAEEYEKVRTQIQKGWYVKIFSDGIYISKLIDANSF